MPLDTKKFERLCKFGSLMQGQREGQSPEVIRALSFDKLTVAPVVLVSAELRLCFL